MMMTPNHMLWVTSDLPPQLEKASILSNWSPIRFWLWQKSYWNQSAPFHCLCLALGQPCPDQNQIHRNELQAHDKDVKQKNIIIGTFQKSLVRPNAYFPQLSDLLWFTLEYYLIRSASNDSSYFVVLMILYISAVWWVNHCLSQFMASIFFIVFCLSSSIQGDVNFLLLTFLTPLGRLSWRIRLLTNQQPTHWTPSCTSSLGMWEPANFWVVQNQDVPPHKRNPQNLCVRVFPHLRLCKSGVKEGFHPAV